MKDKGELSSDTRHLAYQWEDIPKNSPLSKEYAEILMAYVTERVKAEDKRTCDLKRCGKPAWALVHENPLKLKDKDGVEIERVALGTKLHDLVLDLRKKTTAICKGHLVKNFIDSEAEEK